MRPKPQLIKLTFSSAYSQSPVLFGICKIWLTEFRKQLRVDIGFMTWRCDVILLHSYYTHCLTSNMDRKQTLHTMAESFCAERVSVVSRHSEFCHRHIRQPLHKVKLHLP